MPALQDDEEAGRVVPFRRRPGMPAPPLGPAAERQSPVESLDKYERTGTPDDYRHRMKVNAMAFLLLAVLIGGGVWIVDTIAQLRKNQDCALQGRRNCAQITMPATAE
jgi:hypothetical protein